ncbi:FKBP-type peptidyl-prolyl cis-trans isomerase [uncultured Polaribacter sp.]|uniref:FKBP-type peptidyl-prolyl cis-trans isomerase n=1 Tax=uncultured Polaribacter sp. TaxID=174711 RepID=UPI002634ED5C|nr:FKBP-type peptidyl-prolyl cis-trans isomerase [uncultured Polaribacter sp.]
MKNYIILFLSITLLSSCLSNEDNNIVAETETDIIAYIENNNLDATRTASGLYYVITKEGTGQSPVFASDVIVSIKGSFLDGTVFSENNANGVPVRLRDQILGIVEGLQFFKEGGEGILLIPTELGFNDGVALVIEVKLIDVIDNNADILEYIATNNLDAQKTESGLYYVIDKEGNGARPNAASSVTVAYQGFLLDGTVFDQSDAEGITFDLNAVIAGWTEGLQLFKEGGEGTLIIPNELGYGITGIPPTIPGGAVLIFDIKLLKTN